MIELIKKRLVEEIPNSELPKVEIAKKIGVPQAMITQYTTTNKLPRLDTFAKLSKELDLSADYILGLKDI